MTALNEWNTTMHYGVRSAGKKVGGKWRVTVGDPELGPDAFEGRGEVYFASKNSTKAVKYVTHAYCGE